MQMRSCDLSRRLDSLCHHTPHSQPFILAHNISLGILQPVIASINALLMVMVIRAGHRLSTVTYNVSTSQSPTRNDSHVNLDYER